MTLRDDTLGPGHDWLRIVHSESLETFAQWFTEDAILEATVLDESIRGASGIRRLFSAAATMYDTFVFTNEATQGAKTYLEWEGTALGGLRVVGVTVLTR